MTHGFADAPISRKLTVLMAVTSMVALLVASIALGGYEVVAFRRALAQQLTTVADIVGRNCTAALAFGDQSVAGDLLGALSAEPSVRTGAVYDRNGRLFATYSSGPGIPAAPAAFTGGLGTRFEGWTVVAVRPILLDGERVGTVSIRATIDELWTRFLVFASVMLSIVIACSVIATALSKSLQRWITDPILNLAVTARRVASEGNFALRAERAGEDEVGTLVDDFNRMLGEIERQDRQLRVHQEQLESEVTKRTSELVAANLQLTASVERAELYTEQIGQLTSVGQLLQSCQSVEEVYNVVQHAMARLFPFDSGSVSVLNSSGNLLESMTTWGVAPMGQRVFGPDECWAFRLGRPHLASEFESPLRCVHFPADTQTTTLCVPMTAQGDSLGILHFSFAAPRVAGKDVETDTLRSTRGRLAIALGEHIALALANLRLREALRNQSIIDKLTGLFNRRYVEGILDRECRRASRGGRPLAVLVLDVDHFKRFNDVWGHDGGDAVLRDLAALMQSHFRGEDIACRYGGEEFVMVLPDSTLAAATRRAEEFRLAVHTLEVQHGEHTVGTITVSIGVSALPEHGLTPGQLIEVADRALYEAKRLGRDRTVAADVVGLPAIPL